MGNRCSPSEAARAATLLLGCYRKGDATDPDVYVTAIAATLADYPPEVIQHVVSPTRGLPSTLKFLPSVAEVREACEKAMTPIRAAAHRERNLAKQIAERESEVHISSEERARRAAALTRLAIELKGADAPTQDEARVA